MITLETSFRSSPTFHDPLGMLEACHRRIELALRKIAAIAEREREAPLNDSAQLALSEVLHYFEVGVPRHAQDEELSLIPRLNERLTAAERQTVERIEREHATLDGLHAELNALGRRLQATLRFQSQAQRSRFGELIGSLQAIYTEHIRLEDEELFPAAAGRLEAETIAEVGAEMASRRGIDWEAQRGLLADFDRRPWARK
jgi:hemerythrin-like domain-containing protein